MRVSNSANTALRRLEILNATLEIISERGFAAARIIDIAKHSGISTGLILYYFPSKAELFASALAHAEDSWYFEVERELLTETTSKDELEMAIGLCLIGRESGWLALPWSLWVDLWNHAIYDPALANVQRESDARWKALLHFIVAAGVERGEFTLLGDLEVTIASLSAMLDGLAIALVGKLPESTPEWAFDLTMQFAAQALGFSWTNTHRFDLNVALATKS